MKSTGSKATSQRSFSKKPSPTETENMEQHSDGSDEKMVPETENMEQHSDGSDEKMAPMLETLNKRRKHVLKMQDMRKERGAKKEHEKYVLDSNAKERIRELMAKTEAEVTLESVRATFKLPSTTSLQNYVDEYITEEKIKRNVGKLQTFSNKLEEGEKLEEHEVHALKRTFKQTIVMKNKLKNYMAPFLQDSEYVSLGRIFTKLTILQKIVNKLHYYVKNDDTIVDFCCGANDFSLLMKAKLEATNKRCDFKNYDIIYPKNDFCFEKRDWITSKKEELQLPNGKNLIMGLHPPFGDNAHLANDFIDKALEFHPRVMILIAPITAAKRLYTKQGCEYQLIWEDKNCLKGKAFYLPGSVNIDNNNPIEYEYRTPPSLSLWSRKDWTARHIAPDEGKLQNKTFVSKLPSPAMQSGQHCERRSMLPIQKPSGGSSTSNQPVAQHKGFVGDSVFSAASYQLPALHTGFEGGSLTGSAGDPSSYSTQEQFGQHTVFAGGPLFPSTSNPVGARFRSLDPLPNAPYHFPSYDSSS